MTCRLAWTLLAVLLWAGQVQAWHAPSHIDDYSGHLVHQEGSCVLGVNGHGAALPPPVLGHHLFADAGAPQPVRRSSHASCSTRSFSLPPLRGPPISVAC